MLKSWWLFLCVCVCVCFCCCPYHRAFCVDSVPLRLCLCVCVTQSVLGENEAVREKIRFLESIVQDITKERDAFKAMMKQLTTSQVYRSLLAAGGGCVVAVAPFWLRCWLERLSLQSASGFPG
jgi:hypothetical protein